MLNAKTILADKRSKKSSTAKYTFTF